MQIIRQDGTTMIELADDKFEVGERQVKGVGNGVEFRKFSAKYSAAELADGAPLVGDGNGGEAVLKTVTVLIETVDPARVRAKADAKKFRGLAAEVRRRAGLGGGKGKVAESEKLTGAMLTDWMAGLIKVKGYDFAALPQETREKVHEVAVKVAEKEHKAAEAAAKPKLSATAVETSKALFAVMAAAKAEGRELTLEEAMAEVEKVIRVGKEEKAAVAGV